MQPSISGHRDPVPLGYRPEAGGWTWIKAIDHPNESEQLDGCDENPK